MTQFRTSVATQVDRATWDDRVAAFGGGFFQSYAFAVYEAANAGAQPLFVTVENSAGEPMAFAVLALSSPRVWPFSRYCRTATLGALPLVRDSSVELQRAALAAIELELARRGVFRLYVAAFDSPCSAEVLRGGGYTLSDRAEFYLDISRPLEALSEGLKGGRRTDIRKAEKRGVVSVISDRDDAQAALTRLQAASMERRQVSHSTDGAALAERLRADLVRAGCGVLMLSELHGEAINAALFGVFSERAYYLLSGSSPDGNNAAGPVHILWTAIQHLRERGVTMLNLGGVGLPAEKGDPNYGLYRFKKNFGADPVVQPSGVKTLSKHGAQLFQLLTALKRARG